jgi:hypothetical protein
MHKMVLNEPLFIMLPGTIARQPAEKILRSIRPSGIYFTFGALKKSLA